MLNNKLSILLLLLLGLHGYTIDGLHHMGKNPAGLTDLIKNNSINKTNFEKSKEIIEAYLHNMESINNILPESIVPRNYLISFSMDVGNSVFDGDVVIFGRASDNIYDDHLITLNAGILNISDVNLIDLTNNRNMTIVSTVMLHNLEQFVIKLKEDLNPGSDYELSMKFSGEIRNEHGLYASSYPGKSESPILMTEFQPTYARHTFPCWDEPKYKASFTIRVAREPDVVTLSNMPLNFSSEPDPDEGGKVWDTFEKSPEMSTYLVAIVVGDLGVITDEEHNVSIWTEPGKEKYAEYALNFTTSVIEKLEDFIGIEYLLPKLDQVAAPSSYFDAMENWGVIAYIDRYLLVDDEDSVSQKQDVAFHIAHEVAHQWFGNLVTFEWWNNVWINEGFAQFYQYLMTDSLEPDWRAMEMFVVNDLQYILGKDAYIYTHPLSEKSIESTDEIKGMFDNVSYLKGGSIIRMLYHILTPQIFQQGVKRYLEVNSLKSVTDKNLWESFREINATELDLPADVEEIMHNWIHEEGYPIVLVDRSQNDSVPIHTITLTQKYFVKERHPASLETSDKKWWIPLTYTTSTELDFEDTIPKEWFNVTTDEHELNIFLEEDEWAILNIQLTGFYRVNYDSLSWSLIIDDMIDSGFNDIHPLNRAALIDDAFNLALSGYIDVDVFMNLTRYLTRETDMIPWQTASTVFRDLDSSLQGTPAQPLFHRYVQWLTSCWHAEIGFNESENDTDATKLSRALLLNVACSFGLSECRDKALEHVYLMMSEVDVSLPTNLEEIHLCIAVEQGPSEVWQYVRKRYIESNNKGKRLSLINSMVCSKDPAIIKQMLKDSLDDHSFLSKNDGSYLIGSLISKMNPELMDIVMEFFSKNLDELTNLHGETKVTSYFLRMALKLNKNSTKVHEFIDKHKSELKGIAQSIKSNLKYIGYSILKDEYYEKVYEWLKNEEENFETDEPDDYDTEVDEDNLETTTIINEEVTENSTDYTTTEEEGNVETTTDLLYDESEENISKINLTKILEKGIDDIVETATEIINEKIVPKIPIKQTENIGSSNIINIKIYFITYLLLVLVLSSIL